MPLLQTLELQLGLLDLWPSYILDYLFITTPSPLVIKALTAFFFGNGVPPAMAYRLYRACCQQSSETVKNMFYEWFFFWHWSLYSKRLTVYYSMRYKRLVYLSGSRAGIGPIPVLGVSPPKLGIFNTSCPFAILHLLEQVRKL